MTERIAAAYIRESEADANTDKEGQLIDCRLVASREHIDPASLVVYDDWNRSGSESARRPAQDLLIDDIRAGRVGIIVARSLDRMMRSTVRMAEMYRLCEKHGTRIVTLREGEMREDNPSQWIARQSIMTAAEYESRVAKVRARAAVATKTRNGIPQGRAKYDADTTAAVLAAFDEAGTFLGAVKALTTAGVPSMLGGKPNPRGNGSSYGWNVRTVARIIRRERPGMPAKARQGDRGPAHRHVLSGLLTCACDATLSSMPRPGGKQVGYWCRKAHSDPGHSRPYVVSERFLLPWIKAELSHLRLPVDAVQLGREATAERADLTAQRERLALGYARGGLTQATYEAEDGALVVRLAALGDTEEAAAVSPIRPEEWDTWTPADLNAYVRAIVREIRLGSDMRPVSALWRNPALRRACDDPACTHCPARRSAEVSEARSVVAGEVVTMTGAEAMQARLSQAIDDLQADRITLAESRKITAEANRELRKIERALRS
jgi:DNA invertase Pin-like site-specific DNA recombinase